MIEFVKTRHNTRTGSSEYNMVVNGVVKKRDIFVNKAHGIDQRAFTYFTADVDNGSEESTKVATDEMELFNQNYNYLTTLYGLQGNFKKDYLHTYKEVKNIF